MDKWRFNGVFSSNLKAVKRLNLVLYFPVESEDSKEILDWYSETRDLRLALMAAIG